MKPRTNVNPKNRRGSVLVITTLLLVLMLTFLAFAIDIDSGTPARLAAAGVADPGPIGRRPS